MHFKHLALTTLVGAASAQTQNLNATLAGNNNTSGLAAFLGQYSSLLQSLNSLSNITVLAPSNQALTAALNSSVGQALSKDPNAVQALFQYHVLNGTHFASSITNISSFIPSLLTDQSYTNVTGGQVVEAVKIGNQTAFFSGLLQNATISQTDLNFTGGVIHVIDNLLTLPLNVSDSATATNLTALNGALNATSLTKTVNEAHDVTIFAPNNDAFQSIGSALENMTTNELTGILSYHVISGGKVGYSSTLINGTSLKTVQGGNITIHIENGTVFVNSAKVLTPDILVANGVIHIIDNVLNPNNTSVAPSSSATAGSPAYTSASKASGVPFTSGQPTPTTTINPTSAGAGPASTRVSSSSKAAAVPMKTGAVGAAALFGAGAVLLNY
ncbi:Fasciclin-domain-containing protein [Glonium stellatum]|uniref:Fasciclin-domain-containing protein n=1 Tax=Glonium stellatum TaxID=574774 RepID=A0A8E2EMP9_9PEZI|nr:Fasciclin-domain-containing protein [Glonium stellatum]